MTTLTVERGAQHSEPRPSLIRRLAGIYRRTEKGIEQTLYSSVNGAPARMETLLAHLVRFGAVDLARKIAKRFTDVVEGRKPEPLTAQMQTECQRLDSEEDVAELAYLLDRSATNLDRVIRAKERAAWAELRECDSLRDLQRATEERQ